MKQLEIDFKVKNEPLNEIEIPNKNHLFLKNILYCIENKITGDKYVGVSTREFRQRLYQHLTLHSKKKSSGADNRTTLYDDLNKYGAKIFKAYVIEQNKNLKYLRSKEKMLMTNSKEFYKYSDRDRNRDLSRKRKYTKIICKDFDNDELLEFKSASECARYFNCCRSGVTKSLSGQYKLKGKWIVTCE